MLLIVKKHGWRSYPAFLLLLVCLACLPAAAQKSGSEAKGYFTIENYYKIKWGYADEFIDLWKKNHYPLLKKAQEKGDIISIMATKPQLHSGEDTRWDFKVSIVFKNIGLAFDPDLVTPYKAQLYPDADKLTRDEQHRFELVIAHWDIPVAAVELR